MTELDRVPVKELMVRYRLGRTALYERLKALGIEPVRDGRLSYVSGEQLKQLDDLDNRIQSGGRLPSTENRMIPPNNSPDTLIERAVINRDAIAQFILSLLPSDPFEDLEQLERLSRFGWIIPTSRVRALIGQTPRGQEYVWGSFKFVKVGKVGREAGWRVENSNNPRA